MLGLNLHNTVITQDIHEAMDTVRNFGMFTIRTDCNSSTAGVWKNGTQFPFIVQSKEIENYKDIECKIQSLIDSGYALIIADVIKYYNIQIYNAVAYLEENGKFIVEVSTKKVPLRKMYHYDGIFIAEGNICEGVREVDFYGVVDYDKIELLRDMGELYTKGIYKKWIEFTKHK